MQLTSWKCKIAKLRVRYRSSLISFRTQDLHLKTALRLTFATVISLSSSLLAVPSTAADPSRAVAKGDYGQRVVVSQTQNLDPLRQRIVVRGRQFNPRVGVYVALCVRPKEGGAPSPCGGGIDLDASSQSSAWVSSNPPPYARNLVTPFKKKGRFTVSLDVSSRIGDVDCRRIQCAITIRADHTRSRDRSHDIIIPVDFR